MQVCEIVGIRDGQYHLEEVFGFEQTGVDAEGTAVGEFYATGYRPKCLGRMKAAGVTLSDDLFVQRRFRSNGAV